MDSDFVVGINKSIDAAKGETGKTYPAYLHNTLVTEKLDELAEAITEGGGGASALSDLEDVDISGTVQGGKVLKYNAVEEKWAPGDDSGNVQSDWNESDSSSGAYILNKPTIPDAQVQANWNESDSSSKAYIQNKPTIPAAQVNADWNASSGVAEILNKPTIPAAITGLDDIPDVDLTTPTDGQVIKYDATLSKWVNVDSSYRSIHSDLKVYRTMDSYETTISIYSDSDALLYRKIINAGNHYGHFDPITEHFDVSGVTNTITMYGDGIDADTSQNWLHIILNDFQYDLGNTVRNPSFPLDLTVDSSVKTGAPVQSDWNESDPTSEAYILNKPTIPSSTILTQTLSAGQTTVTFTDASIETTSLISVYADVWYSSMTTSAGSCAIVFPAQSSDLVVAIEIK